MEEELPQIENYIATDSLSKTGYAVRVDDTGIYMMQGDETVTTDQLNPSVEIVENYVLFHEGQQTVQGLIVRDSGRLWFFPLIG